MTSVTIEQPVVSSRLMTATYVVSGLALFMAFYRLGQGEDAAAAAWASAGVVGTAGVLSFFRHSVFHRSDAARMGWDYGRRNDFQIEVGLANLAVGLVAIGAWALGWGTAAEGAVVLVYAVYMLGATAMHGSELRRSSENGGGRPGPLIATAAYAVALGYLGFVAVNA
jgi:hypothetical protein